MQLSQRGRLAAWSRALVPDVAWFVAGVALVAVILLLTRLAYDRGFEEGSRFAQRSTQWWNE